MASHNELGKRGEQIVLEYLIQSGYQILEQNFRFGRDEVDIIAKHESQIVFIEVKTRMNSIIGEPEEAVNRSKQKRIIRVANHYLVENDLDNEARFDIFGITFNQSKENINHIESAFTPEW